MNNRYQYDDLLFKESNSYPFLDIAKDFAIMNIFRLISGSIDVSDLHTGKKYKIRKNFTTFPYSKNKRISQKILINNFPPEVNLSDLNTYFNKSKSNIKFYKSIESELIKCIIANEENKYLESFFYLYRILEGISYSLPLIYTSRKNDYNKTYKDLQSYFGKDNDGELAFFKRFIVDIYKNEEFYNSTIDINLLEIEIDEIRPKYYSIYIKYLDEKKIKTKNENVNIEVEFLGFYSFLIVLRNRFFHNAKGGWQDNLESTDILYPDSFFKPLMNNSINWVSIILFELIKFDFEKIK